MSGKVLQFPTPQRKLPTAKDEVVDKMVDDLLACFYAAKDPVSVTDTLVKAAEAAWEAGYRFAANGAE